MHKDTSNVLESQARRDVFYAGPLQGALFCGTRAVLHGYAGKAVRHARGNRQSGGVPGREGPQETQKGRPWDSLFQIYAKKTVISQGIP